MNVTSSNSLLHYMPLLQERVQSSLSVLGCGTVAGPLEEGAAVSRLLHFVIHPPPSPVAVFCLRYESPSEIYKLLGADSKSSSHAIQVQIHARFPLQEGRRATVSLFPIPTAWVQFLIAKSTATQEFKLDSIHLIFMDPCIVV